MLVFPVCSCRDKWTRSQQEHSCPEMQVINLFSAKPSCGLKKLSKYLLNLRIKFYDITIQMKAKYYLILRIKISIFCELCLRAIIICLKIWLGKNLPFSNHFTFHRIICFSDPFTGTLWWVTCSIFILLAYKEERTFESLCGYDRKISMYGCV